MKKYWNIIKKDLIRLIAITGFSYIAGLLYDFTNIYFITEGSSNFSVVPMGSILSVTIGAIYWVLGSTISLKTRFTLAVSMSTTRKNYIIQEIISTILGSLILCAMCIFLFWLETEVYIHLLYGGVPSGDVLLFDEVYRNLSPELSLNMIRLLVIICFIVGIRLFFGFIILRFQSYAFWIIWAVGMLWPALYVRLERTKFYKVLCDIYLDLFAPYRKYFPLLLISSILITVIGIYLLKRQEIRNV